MTLIVFLGICLLLLAPMVKVYRWRKRREARKVRERRAAKRELLKDQAQALDVEYKLLRNQKLRLQLRQPELDSDYKLLRNEKLRKQAQSAAQDKPHYEFVKSLLKTLGLTASESEKIYQSALPDLTDSLTEQEVAKLVISKLPNKL